MEQCIALRITMQLLAILPIKHLLMLTSTLGVSATLPSLHHHVASWNPARCLHPTSSRPDNTQSTLADCGLVNGFTCARSAHDHDTYVLLDSSRSVAHASRASFLFGASDLPMTTILRRNRRDEEFYGASTGNFCDRAY